MALMSVWPPACRPLSDRTPRHSMHLPTSLSLLSTRCLCPLQRFMASFSQEDMADTEDALSLDFRGALYKRKDYLDKDEDAKSHPNRTYYYRKNVDVDKLIETCSRRLGEDANNAKALFIRASSYMKKHEYQLAIDDYSLALQINQNDVACVYNRGMAYEKMGALNESIRDYTRVLEIDPNHVNAAYARAACHNRKGHFSRAIEDYNLALMKDQQIRLASPGACVRVCRVPCVSGRKRDGEGDGERETPRSRARARTEGNTAICAGIRGDGTRRNETPEKGGARGLESPTRLNPRNLCSLMELVVASSTRRRGDNAQPAGTRAVSVLVLVRVLVPLVFA